MRLYLRKPPGQPTISKVLFFLKQHSPKIIFVLIGLTQQTGKLVFVSVHSKNAVIASQCAHWRGNPPVREEMYRQLPYRSGNAAIFGGNRYLVPFNRGIAIPVCGLVRKDS